MGSYCGTAVAGTVGTAGTDTVAAGTAAAAAGIAAAADTVAAAARLPSAGPTVQLSVPSLRGLYIPHKQYTQQYSIV